VTIAHLAAATDATERGRRLRQWAEDVWGAYDSHHADIRRWVDALLQ
jgi:hypothetical protein